MRQGIKGLLIGIGVAFLVVGSFAHEGHKKHSGKAVTVEGEVVDLSCYLSHGGRGAKHAKCADLCLRKGLPMGILTKDGKLYLLLEDHGSPKAYAQLKKLAARIVRIAGVLHSKKGMQGIAVQKVMKVIGKAK